MNGKIVFCFAVVFVGQAMSAATTTGLEVEDFKKIFDQFSQSSMSIANYMVGVNSNSADFQKSVDKVRTLATKAFADFEEGSSKLKDTVLKTLDPKVGEKIDELEKDLKKQIADAKVIFDDKIGKPLSEKIEAKKMTDTFIKTAKELEVGAKKVIDQIKNTKP